MGRGGGSAMKCLPFLTALALLLGGCNGRVLTVCADPDNMPFSHRSGAGFENKVAQIVADDLGAELRYHWWSQRRGFVRNTLGQGACDVWMTVPSGLESVLTTRPWYRSSYMLVTRASDPLAGLTLDDPRMRKLDLGVQLAGEDGANPPPADALARRGLIERTRGFMLYRDAGGPEPGAQIVGAVADREIDVGLVWGPTAGWYAARSPAPLRLEPVTPWLDGGRWPMVFDISMGVAKENQELRVDLEQSLVRQRSAINRVLKTFHVPPGAGG
jgi:mxaJ protein